MDSSLIEKSAINYLIDELIVTKKLSPYISEKDKEPSWEKVRIKKRKNSETIESINQFLLKMILGYDESQKDILKN